MLSYNAMDCRMSRTKYFLKKTTIQEGENFQKKKEEKENAFTESITRESVFPHFVGFSFSIQLITFFLFCMLLRCSQESFGILNVSAIYRNDMLFCCLGTLLVSHSENPRDKQFLWTMVSYFKYINQNQIIKGKKIPLALSELPANQPGLTSLLA